MIGPQPRYRLYTVPSARYYVDLFRDLATSRLTEGDDVELLEEAVKRRTGAEHALAMPRCRVGIYLAIKALIQPGQEVILQPYTIADVVNMVIAAGGKPRFADIDRETCNVLPAEVERLMGPDTGAVLVTHLHGLACPIEELAAMCQRRGVPLIEDAAQAFGARVGGRSVGTFGDVGVFSFGMYKNVTSLFGGMVVCKRAEHAARMRAEMQGWPFEDRRTLLRKAWTSFTSDVSTTSPLFQSVVFPIFRYGFLNEVRAINKKVEIELDLGRHDQFPEIYRRRLNPGQARLALARLAGVDAASAQRVAYAKVYHEGLRGLPGLWIPPLREDGSHIYTYFAIQYEPRKELLRWVMSRGRDMAGQHIKNTADLDSFSEWRRDCPNARAVATSLILCPTYPRYGLSEVEANVRAIRAFFERGAGGVPEVRTREAPAALPAAR